MANSLMELYGGGMTGKPTNYQLGGRIARSNLERAVQGEQRELQRKQQEAARKKSRAQGLGTIFGGLGSLAGSLIPIPGLGTALGGAIGSGLGAGLGQLLGESTFRGTNVGEGRFLQQDRGDLQDSIDDFKSSLGERALATGISKFATSAAANLPGIKDELGFGTRTLAPENIYDSGVAPSDLGFLQDLPDLPATLDLNVPFSLPTDLSQPIDDLIDPITGEKRPSFVGPMLPQMRGGGLLGMMLPQMQVGGMLDPFEIDRFEVGGEGQGAMQNPLPIPPPPPPPTLPPSTVPGYGTAMTIQGALGQLGMQDIANDPRLQQYMSELPQFGMGYAQQLGDIQTSGQQTLRDMRGQAMQAAGQRGFSGSGIGQRQMATSLGDLRTDIARQRRGVIEGFQADLLGAIGDIERSGQFEFGTNLSQDLTTETAPEDILAIANEQNITVQEAEEEYNRQRDRDERRRYGG
jgi:hypothetical protein